MEKEYFEFCPKSKSNNIIFCPQPNNQEKNDKKVWWINDYFNNIYEEKKKNYRKIEWIKDDVKKFEK